MLSDIYKLLDNKYFDAETRTYFDKSNKWLKLIKFNDLARLLHQNPILLSHALCQTSDSTVGIVNITIGGSDIITALSPILDVNQVIMRAYQSPKGSIYVERCTTYRNTDLLLITNKQETELSKFLNRFTLASAVTKLF